MLFLIFNVCNGGSPVPYSSNHFTLNNNSHGQPISFQSNFVVQFKKALPLFLSRSGLAIKRNVVYSSWWRRFEKAIGFSLIYRKQLSSRLERVPTGLRRTTKNPVAAIAASKRICCR
jgi:hypothetical protein